MLDKVYLLIIVLFVFIYSNLYLKGTLPTYLTRRENFLPERSILAKSYSSRYQLQERSNLLDKNYSTVTKKAKSCSTQSPLDVPIVRRL